VNHQFVGRPIGKLENASLEINGEVSSFGPGVLYDSNTAAVADEIRLGNIVGEIYADGEVWADPHSLTAFRARHIPA
jgi:hypothetical protein